MTDREEKIKERRALIDKVREVELKKYQLHSGKPLTEEQIFCFDLLMMPFLLPPFSLDEEDSDKTVAITPQGNS